MIRCTWINNNCFSKGSDRLWRIKFLKRFSIGGISIFSYSYVFPVFFERWGGRTPPQWSTRGWGDQDPDSIVSVITMWRPALLVFLLSIINCCIGTLGPVAHIDDGALQGRFMTTRYGREFSAFLGIPYARPPLGHLRFQVRNSLRS